METTMTNFISEPASATHLVPIPLVRFGLSLSLFFAITFVLCVLFGLLVSERGVHELFPTIFPGFVWLTGPGFLIGLVESFFYGWYAALLFGALFNFFARWRE
jgi:hypothetical protein